MWINTVVMFLLWLEVFPSAVSLTRHIYKTNSPPYREIPSGRKILVLKSCCVDIIRSNSNKLYNLVLKSMSFRWPKPKHRISVFVVTTFW